MVGKKQAKQNSPSRPPSHVTHGNILDDLGFTPEERAMLEVKVKLFDAIFRDVREKGLKPRDLERIFDVPQPRVSELMRGKIGRMQIETLLKYALRLGLKPSLSLPKAA